MSWQCVKSLSTGVEDESSFEAIWPATIPAEIGLNRNNKD